MSTLNTNAASTPDAQSASHAAPRSYGRVAARGMLWMTLNTVFSKIIGFAAQIILGWLLSKSDYAVFALALAVYGLLATFRDGGLQKILIQRGKEYETLASPVFQMALLFNIALAVLLVSCSPLAGWYFTTPGLPAMLWVMAFTAVISTPTIVFQAKLLRDLRFGLVTKITATSTIINYVSMVGLALLGFGPLSFVIPGAVVAMYEGIAYGIASGFLPNRNPLSRRLFTQLLRASGWIMFGALATTLINGGDYLVIGKLQKDLLGDYTFGFQFSASFAVLFALGARSVLMPTLTQFSDQIQRFGHAYLRSIRLLTFVGTPICVAVALIVPPLVDFLWNGKWNPAIPVIQVMTLSLIFRLLTPVALAALEARGRWKLQSILLIIDGVGTVVSAIIGCLIGGLVAITVCVGINRAVMAVIQCIAAGSLGSAPASRIMKALGGPVVSSAVCGLASFAIARMLALESAWLQAMIAVGLFALLWLAATWAFERSRLRELRQIAASLKPSRSPAG